MNPLRESHCSEAQQPQQLKPTCNSGSNTEPAFDHSGDFNPECAELLHGLNNVLVGMLLNAQVLEWKLPSYSRLKRNLHEIERNAQRGGELVKRLLKRLSVPQQEQLMGGQCSREAAGLNQAAFASVNSEPDVEMLTDAECLESVTPKASPYGGNRKKVPHTPV